MTEKKQRNPDIDWGFYATIPRLIRTEHKDLTPVQKWLYVSLKDLCGETGTCYRALRVLAEETGISTGMLSESIPILHKAGLIHAEKKKRSAGGKEVWHITIVDIWQANAQAHPTKRSQNEQTSENVHTVNENVHTVNDVPIVCSQNERECSLCETEAISLSNINNEAIPIEEYVSANAESAGVCSHTELSLQSPIAMSTRSAPRLQARLTIEKPPPPGAETHMKEAPALRASGPPVMPPEDAPWCAETAVQVIEAIKGRRYGEATRKQELAQAAKALRFEVDGTRITRAQFVTAWREMEGWSVWGEKHITPLIRHLVKDDKIVTLLERTRRAPPSEESPKVRPLVLVSEAQSNKNKEAMFARANAARQALEAKKAAR